MLDRLHARLVRSRLLQRFTAFTRVLLAVGFIPPGLKKLTGEPFTSLPTSHPVGSFFDAFFQAGEFYAFVGLAQVAAGLLLLWPRTATLGAVIYFPIILTIAVITNSIGFAGTDLITILMTLACLWLLVWDYDRLRAILPRRGAAGRAFGPREYALQAGLWAAAGVAAAAVTTTFGMANLTRFVPVAGALALGGAAFGVVVAWHLRRLPDLPASGHPAMPQTASPETRAIPG